MTMQEKCHPNYREIERIRQELLRTEITIQLTAERGFPASPSVIQDLDRMRQEKALWESSKLTRDDVINQTQKKQPPIIDSRIKDGKWNEFISYVDESVDVSMVPSERWARWRIVLERREWKFMGIGTGPEYKRPHY